MIRYLPYLVELALLVYCLIDAIQTDEAEVRNLPKVMWIILIIIIPIVGPVAWLVAGRPNTGSRRRSRSQQGRGSFGNDRGPRRPPRGPDDDPEFLKDL